MTLELLERAPTSGLSEAEIVRGYSRAALSESVSKPCACGEVIVAVSSSHGDIERALSSHNASTVHEQWRARRECA